MGNVIHFENWQNQEQNQILHVQLICIHSAACIQFAQLSLRFTA